MGRGRLVRIRSIKPEFWRSEDIAALDWDARLVFIGLWSYVDDNGVGRDDERIICAELFALDDPLSEPSVRAQAALNTLSRHGLITRYSVDGRRYLHIVTWDKHQKINRPSEPRLPLPTCDDAEIRNLLSEPSVSPHNILRAGTGEQGNRGTGEEETCSPAPPSNATEPTTPPGFAEFWNAYPRKEAKQAALKSWPKAVKLTSRTTLIEGALRLAQDPNREDEFTPLAASWLNAGRWEDDPLPDRKSTTARPRPSTTDAGMAAIQAMKNHTPQRLEIT